jgi:beta-glucosidase
MSARPGAAKSDIGWEILPQGLEVALRACARFRVPLVVTENGIADAADRWRPGFIRASLAALDRARAAGVDVRGYFHWSLMDNFEWQEGYEGKFGLYSLGAADGTGERPSARVYAEEVARRR